MNTNALAFMSWGLDQQVGFRCGPLSLGVRVILLLAYPLFASNSKHPFGFISGDKIGKLGLSKYAINLRL